MGLTKNLALYISIILILILSPNFVESAGTHYCSEVDTSACTAISGTKLNINAGSVSPALWVTTSGSYAAKFDQDIITDNIILSNTLGKTIKVQDSTGGNGGALYIYGGKGIASPPVVLGVPGGNVFIAGGSGDGDEDGNVYLAHTGSAARGAVGIGTSSVTSGYLLDVNGNTRAADFCTSSGTCLSTTSASNSNYGNFNYVISEPAGWFKLGTLTLPQEGNNALIRLYGGEGYNADNNQNSYVNLFIRTSNAMSVDPNGFCASAFASKYGRNSNFVSTIKLKSNAAGCSATSYDIYIYTGVYIGKGWYSVEASPGFSWTPSSTTASDPGVASNIIYTVPFEHYIQSNTLINANLSVGGIVNVYGNISTTGMVNAVGDICTTSGGTNCLSTLSSLSDTLSNVILNQKWVNCEGDICYMGNTSGGATILTKYPSSDVSINQWTKSGCTNEFECLDLNQGTWLTTNGHSSYVYGEYTLSNFDVPIGSIISEVKIEAQCRISGAHDTDSGRIYMSLSKGGSLITTYVVPSSTTWQTYSYVFPTSFNNNAWISSNLNGVIYGLDGISPYTATSSVASSLIAGSHVLMADNSYKNIENIKVGDLVVSYDTKNNKSVIRKVLSTSSGTKKFLTINNDLSLSPDHLIYTVNKGYIPAKDVKIGDKLINSDGSLINVHDMTSESKELVDVYDFHVDYPNNFFANNYLVHNELVKPMTYTYGNVECAFGRLTVTYLPSTSAKVKINAQTGSTETLGQITAAQVAAPLYTGNAVSVNSVSSTNLASNTLNVNKICLNGKCITDFSQLSSPPSPTCQWINPDAQFPPGGYYANRMNVSGISLFTEGQCRASCAPQRPYCPASTGIISVATAASLFPLLSNYYLCDNVDYCFDDVDHLCNVNMPKRMPMQTVSIQATNGLEVCV